VNHDTIGTLDDLDDLDDLPEATEVVVRRQNPAVVLGGLVVVGILASLVVIFVVSVFTGVVYSGKDGAPVLDLAQVETSSNIDFPEGSEVLASSPASSDVFTAEVMLPGVELPDFSLAGYAATDAPADVLAESVVGQRVVQSYAAASPTLRGSAVLVDRDSRLVLFVDVRAAD
jgi:hypothetical protein